MSKFISSYEEEEKKEEEETTLFLKVLQFIVAKIG